MFRISLKIFLLSLFATLLLVSCEQEDIQELTDVATTTRNMSAAESYLYMTAEDEIADDARLTLGGDRKPCFTPVFPIVLLFSDGSTMELNSKEELKVAMRDYRRENRGNAERPTVQFPHDVELNDGSIVTVEGRGDVKELLEACRESIGDENKCFDLIFPVTLVYPDGNTEEIDSKERFREAMQSWRSDNGDSRMRPTIQFPYQVEDRNGQVLTIESKDDKKELIMSCRPDRFPCFNWVFPINLILPDGAIAEVGSSDELTVLLMDWRDDNPEVTGRPKVQFPQEIQLENGRKVTVESPRQLATMTRACRRMHHRDRIPGRGNGPR